MLNIGHRGARRLAPENTLDSLRIALEEGADGVEFDVQRTCDGELVLFHDDHLGRLTGRDLPLRVVPFRDLRRLRVAGPNGSSAAIPHFDEVLALLGAGRCLANAELKVDVALANGTALAEAFGRAAAAVEHARWVVSSFHRAPLERLHQGGLGFRLGALVESQEGGDWHDLVAPVELPLASVHPEHALVTPERMARWREAPWPVWAWTANLPQHWERLHSEGVAACITDDPGGMRAHFDRLRPRG
ncbi:MAG: glycerophosphodiester phosphodiesterase [Myxococcales bacterium]|nr:glycerophosphodiester phosphodiesterase [Myxococcales bacterium]